MLAAKEGREAAVKLLFDQEANIEVEDKESTANATILKPIILANPAFTKELTAALQPMQNSLNTEGFRSKEHMNLETLH